MQPIREIILIPLAIASLGVSALSWAQNMPPNPERQAECQKQAAEKGLRSGPERQSFMRECVHGKAAVPATAAKPATPAEAAKPAMAKEPAKPAVPAEPAKSATPVEPAKPAVAKAPAKAPPPASRKDDCMKQADEKSLRGADRKSFMQSCMHPR
jgi:hypothetical protein